MSLAAQRERGARGTGSTTIQSVARASRILLLVAVREDGITAKDVATEFDLTLPTSYHLLATLVDEGLLAKDSRRRYTLGHKAGVIADAVARDTSGPEYYVDVMRELADRTEETVYLTAWRRGQIRVLSIIEGNQAVRVSGLTPGNYDFPHARASGKLLLALARPEVRDEALRSGRLPRRTPNTIVSRAKLEREFAKIREQGYAVDHEEYSVGVTCISAPIIDGEAVLAALTVSVPTERFARREDELRRATVEIAKRASN
jgi:IclR family transcriptional regulator, acetate operon repressor